MVEAAGLLVFRRKESAQDRQVVEVLLAHPGGPFWARKDDWSIPKGEREAGESLEQAMLREFLEEIGIEPPLDGHLELGKAPVSAVKANHIWAVEADLDLAQFHCDSLATIEWPRGSGKTITFPENDRAEWSAIDVAYRKVFKSQMIFIERLAEALNVPLAPHDGSTNSPLF